MDLKKIIFNVGSKEVLKIPILVLGLIFYGQLTEAQISKTVRLDDTLTAKTLDSVIVNSMVKEPGVYLPGRCGG